MDFTYWESQSIKVAKGPLWGALVFVGGFAVLMLLGSVFSKYGPAKAVKDMGLTLQQVEEIAAVVETRDPAKIDEMLKTYGGDLGTNLPKWRLVLGWKNDSLMQLFVDDLKIAVEGQKAALIQQAEAQALAAQAPKDAPASP